MYEFLAQLHLNESQNPVYWVGRNLKESSKAYSWLLTDQFNLSCTCLHVTHKMMYQRHFKSPLMALNGPLGPQKWMWHWWACGSQPKQWAVRWKWTHCKVGNHAMSCQNRASVLKNMLRAEGYPNRSEFILITRPLSAPLTTLSH